MAQSKIVLQAHEIRKELDQAFIALQAANELIKAYDSRHSDQGYCLGRMGEIDQGFWKIEKYLHGEPKELLQQINKVHDQLYKHIQQMAGLAKKPYNTAEITAYNSLQARLEKLLADMTLQETLEAFNLNDRFQVDIFPIFDGKYQLQLLSLKNEPVNLGQYGFLIWTYDHQPPNQNHNNMRDLYFQDPKNELSRNLPSRAFDLVDLYAVKALDVKILPELMPRLRDHCNNRGITSIFAFDISDNQRINEFCLHGLNIYNAWYFPVIFRHRLERGERPFYPLHFNRSFLVPQF